MQQRHIDRESYFEEQAYTCEKYYIPYLLDKIGPVTGKVLEVGCGEGGNLLPFAKMGNEVVGVDITVSRIEQAKKFFEERNQKGLFIASDVFKLTELHSQFSLIIVHDVIEHIPDKERFLSLLQKYLAPGGYVFFGFPAWQMPFGGHQQIAAGKIISHLPFVHLLPAPLYKSVLRAAREKENTIQELLNIKRTRCPIELFVRLAKRTGYKIVSQQTYFINPHYEVKFGLKPRKLSKWVASVPHIRNYFSTSCFYILSSEK